jgi:hypothetical protein
VSSWVGEWAFANRILKTQEDAPGWLPQVLIGGSGLVKELFDPAHSDILTRYPLAQSAAPEIRDAILHGRDGQAISLESHLREMYRDSDDVYDKRRFYSITLYLQELLWKASKSDHVHFDNTDRLVAVLLRHFDHACFVTLNYDTILDQALGKLDPISEMNDYIRHGRWSVIKLHGSVDWGYRPIGDVSVDDPPADLADRLNNQIHRAVTPALRPNEGPPRLINPNSITEAKTFPALTVPVGEEDEVVCPNSHQAFLARRLASVDELDLLIVGYSAYDRTVIERIAGSEKRIRTLTVVNENADAAEKVVWRLRDLIPQSLNGADIDVADRPFGAWCQESLPTFASHHPTLTSAGGAA